ncbi:MAG: serine hydrolase domain-containing protein [Bacteroidia bacterium]
MVKKHIYPIVLAIAAVSIVYAFVGSTNSEGKPESKDGFASQKNKTIDIPLPPARDTMALSPVEQFESHKIDSFFHALVKHARFNGNVLVAHEGKVLYKGSFGVSDFKTKELLTDSSEFQLGSVSKQFTAVAIMILKEQGKLDYSDTIQKFFPGFPYKGVTVGMLLSHRSGLPNYMYLCGNVCKDQKTPLDNMQVVQLLIDKHPPKYFPPNRKFDYSNTNYCVLAAIAEKVSGVPFAEFLRYKIFTPLGMTHTYIFDKNDTVIPNAVTGYDANYRKAGIDFLDGVAGDKGIFSTTEDVLKWDQALYTDKLLKQSTLKEAFTPHSRWMNQHNYGYGWRLAIFDHDTLVYHDGWWHGFNAAFMRDIKGKNTIIVLSNHVNWCINQSRELLTMLREEAEEDGAVASAK